MQEWFPLLVNACFICHPGASFRQAHAAWSSHPQEKGLFFIILALTLFLSWKEGQGWGCEEIPNTLSLVVRPYCPQYGKTGVILA